MQPLSGSSDWREKTRDESQVFAKTGSPCSNDNHAKSVAWRTTIVNALVGQTPLAEPRDNAKKISGGEFSCLLVDELLERVERPGQYLGNEWGAARRPWLQADVHLALAFPDLYELGMSNFGQRILYQIINSRSRFLADRTYAPDVDLEAQLRAYGLPLWGWESRQSLSAFELVGFSLQYELTYTNILNMLDLAQIPVLAADRKQLFPLICAGGPGALNPEPMSRFIDFFMIGDGEESLPAACEVIGRFKEKLGDQAGSAERLELLTALAQTVPGIYVPALYRQHTGSHVVAPRPEYAAPQQVQRQVAALDCANQPVTSLVPYLSLVHDRDVLEVRRGCDRACRFCQPGYSFLPVRERTPDDLLKFASRLLKESGHQEYSMLSLCISDYTCLGQAVRELSDQMAGKHVSLSLPSQRADRMDLDLAEQLKSVRKGGITLAPEAGSERLRAVINKGLSDSKIISAITDAYQSGWSTIKLYFMIGLPTEQDADIAGIAKLLKETVCRCEQLRAKNPTQIKRRVELTCTISNFVPKPFTPFQWVAQITPDENKRRQELLKRELAGAGSRHIKLNFTDPRVSQLEAVLTRGNRQTGELIYQAWRNGCRFDAWSDRCRLDLWESAAEQVGLSLTAEACTPRPVGQAQSWDIIDTGLSGQWLASEWEKALQALPTPACTEGVCHDCGICTSLHTSHQLASPDAAAVQTNPFIDTAISSCSGKPEQLDSKQPPPATTRLRFEFTKQGELRFISHLDLQHLLARAMRRAGLSMAYSEGFNPAPRLSLSMSLPLFQEAAAEVAEVELAQTIDALTFVDRLNRQLPAQIQLGRAKTVATGGRSLASCVGRASYIACPRQAVLPPPGEDREDQSGTPPAQDDAPTNTVNLSCLDTCMGSSGAAQQARPDTPLYPPATQTAGVPAVHSRIAELLSRATIEVSPLSADKKANGSACREPRDIRPGIYSICTDPDNPSTLQLQLAAGPKMHLKPQEVLRLINPNIGWRVTRVGLSSPDGIPLFDLP